MTTTQILLNRINQCVIDIKSDKVATRNSALEHIGTLLDNQPDDVIRVFESGDENCLSWKNLFIELHYAVQDQCSRLDSARNATNLNTLTNKNDAYKGALIKCINLANQHKLNVPLRNMCEAAFECFRNATMRKYFDGCYLKIINAHILNTKFPLDNLELTHWSQLLSFIFELCVDQDTTISKLELSQCIPPLLRHASRYTYIIGDLSQYLPILVIMIKDESHQYKAQKQILFTIYEMIRCMASSHRKVLVEFTEQVLDRIYKMYQFSLEDDVKEVIIKIFHLSIVIHLPQIDQQTTVNYNRSNDDLFADNIAHNVNQWHKQLQNMFGVIEREINGARKQSKRFSPNLTICDKLVQMAAKLCSVIYWNESVWTTKTTNVNDEQAPKRRRQTMTLERIMELVEYEPQKFCWRWFAILSELLVSFPHLLGIDDYQPLLKLLADYQSTIRDASDMISFSKIITTMLDAEVKLIAVPSSPIRSSFCTEYWHKIIEFAFKQAATDKIQNENLQLMGILVTHGVIVSYDFIKTIITDITKMTRIRKSNDSIGLLINIFRSINVDLINGIDDIKMSVITWLSTRIVATELKRVINSGVDMDDKLIAELYVLCILSRQGQSNTFVKKFDNQKNNAQTVNASTMTPDEYRSEIREFEKNIQYGALSKLIVCDLKNDLDQNKRKHIRFLPDRSEVKAIINETFNAKMEESLLSNDSATGSEDNNHLENFLFVCKSLQMYVNVLNCLIEYEAMDTEALNTSNLKKRMLIRIAQLNDIFAKFDNRINFRQSPEDVNEIVDRLLEIWNDDNHLAVANIIYTQKNDSIISWYLKQLIPSQSAASLVMTTLKHENEMEFQYRVQLKLLTLVAHFSAWDNIDSDNQVIKGIREYDFELTRNEDLFMVFELAKIIFNQKLTTEVGVEWAFQSLQEICSEFCKNQQLIDIVMEFIPAAIGCIKHYEKLHGDLFELLVGVLTKAKKRKYGQSITIKAIKCLQYFAQEFYSDKHCVETLNVLKKFLASECLPIQLATVECLTSIFNKHWLCPDLDSVDCLSIQNFHMKLFDKLNLNQMPRCDCDDGATIDRKANVFATYLQLYSSIIGSCFVLRRQMWFQLIDFCCNQIQLKEEKTQKLITKLCKEMFNAIPSILLERDIPYLLSRWIQESYNLSSFPWQITSSKSKDDFVPEHIECITLNICIYQPNLLQQLVQTMAAKSLSDLLTKSILIKCLAFSINAKHSGSREKKDHGMKVIHTLMQEVPHLEQYLRTDSLQIMEEMLNAMYDRIKFDQLFHMNVELTNDENAMDHECFIKSMEYIQRKCDRPQQSSLLNYFCEHDPVAVINIINRLKLSIQSSLTLELKLYQLFRLCVLIEIITEFLVTKAQNAAHKNTIEFFVRDFIYFFGNIISGSGNAEKMKLATCNYFSAKFCPTILPKCVDQFEPHLNYVVSVLMPMTKLKPPKIVNKAMDLLNFLIVEQRDALHMYIGLLDSFPLSPEFDSLRHIQNESKYDGKTFTLLDEIECFLAIDKRKTEGLLSLKEHLSSKKNELQEIYEHIYDSRGFSEDCDKSVIHRLIFTLLQTVQSVDKEKSILAAKCLGELGPSDLGTMCLRFDSQPQNYKDCPSFADAVGHLCEFMLEKLYGHFAHSDAIVLKATSTACQRLLRSRKVTELLNKYPSLSIFKAAPTHELPFNQPKGQLNLSKWFDDTSFHSTHSIWIKNIAIELFNFFECEYLAELAAMQTQFSEAMVPLLIKVILTTGIKSYLEDINKAIDIFFANHSTKQDSHHNGQANTTAANPPVYMNKISIKLMLNVAECVRIHNQFLETRNDLTMNYLHIAKAASFCNAHFTAILYGELLALDEDNHTDVTVINSIMMNAYKAIGQTDAVSAFLNPIEDPIQYLISKQDWSRTLNILDVTPMSSGFPLYNQYLGQAGLYGLANKLSQATDSTNYECAWRLADWSILNASASTQCEDRESNYFEKYHFFALKSFALKDEIAVRFNIENGLNEIINGLKSSSYECTKNIYKDLMHLNMLQQIEDFCDVQFPRPENVKQNSPEFIIQKWKHQDAVPSKFICREALLAQRIILMRSAGIRAQRKIENVCKLTNDLSIQQMILDLASECREEGCLNMSQRYLASLRELNPSRDMRIKMLYENAKLSWDIGDLVLTKHLIDAVRNERILCYVPISIIRMYGEYLAETRAENTKTIIQEYFKESNRMSKALKTRLESDAQSNQMNRRNAQPSLEVVQKFNADNKIRNLRAIAKYADREYQQIAAYKKSSDFEKKQQNVQKNLKILADLRNESSNLTSNEKRSQILISKCVQIDKADIQSTNDEYDWYLETTVLTYLKCLVVEKNDKTDCFTMFRVFALLLANPTNANILELIKSAFVRIPTFKFIEVIPQITAHLNTNNDAFGNLIHNIVLKCAKEHPHHVIMKLFALANAHVDGDHSGDTPSPARTDASKNILNKLQADEGTRTIVEQMEQMCTVLIALANKKMDRKQSLLSQEPILKLKHLDKVHCPTVKLNVSPSGNYGNIVGIAKYSNELMRPGGINDPKRIACIGTNGKKYLQLLKGRDDPRQDAVMQQVFCIVNNMLNQSKVTKKDRLIIRTYAVIPLSQRSGILEWCTNTTTMGEYLIGSNCNGGAHQRYRPQDRSPSECRILYSQIDRTQPHEQRYLNFLEICQNIQPVFHHFFFEHFYNPGVWFERRMAYAHTLATTSMMCYILGIGDRHINNILIDKTTAEVIHIDFGIAFEQGKCLPTPELIPFRLTRDIISALGPSKVEGVFKKTCEKTMHVLRQHKSTVLTIVEVLMHDPLNAWTLTSSEAAKRQQTDIHLDEQDVNAMAERALLRLEEKLDGKHVSCSDSLSVERHVEILIQEATDDKKLCSLFVGWQPYL